MTLESIRKQIKNAAGETVVTFVVFVDGVPVAAFPTQSSAWAYQDELWSQAQK